MKLIVAFAVLRMRLKWHVCSTVVVTCITYIQFYQGFKSEIKICNTRDCYISMYNAAF